MPTGRSRLKAMPSSSRSSITSASTILACRSSNSVRDQRKHQPQVAQRAGPQDGPQLRAKQRQVLRATGGCCASPGTGCGRRRRRQRALCRRPGRACGCTTGLARISLDDFGSRPRNALPRRVRSSAPKYRNSVRYRPMPSAPRSRQCCTSWGNSMLPNSSMRTPSAVSAGRSRSVSSCAARLRFCSASCR